MNFIGWDEAKSITSSGANQARSLRQSLWRLKENLHIMLEEFFFLVACSVPSLKTRFLFRSFILLKLPACYSIKCNPIRFKNEAAHESTRIFQFVSGFFHFHFDQSSEERHIYELGPIDSMATWCVSYNQRHCDRKTGGFDAMAKNVRRDLSPFRCFRNWTHSMISAAETEV